MTEAAQLARDAEPTTPTPARIYDFMLGGCHNYQVDRDAAAKVMQVVPEIHEIAWANRGFHQRAGRWIAVQGIRQFLDVGAGLPTVGNTHEVVREVGPEARVAYVDVDPMVITQTRALLAGVDGTAVIQADLRDPEALLADPDLRALIDFSEPVGLLMTGVLHFVADGSNPWGLLRSYLRAVAPGSYLAVSHGTSENMPPVAVQRWHEVYEEAPQQLQLRTKAEVRRFFDGLQIEVPYEGAAAEPTHLGLWGCEDPALADSDGSRWGFCGVGLLR